MEHIAPRNNTTTRAEMTFPALLCPQTFPAHMAFLRDCEELGGCARSLPRHLQVSSDRTITAWLGLSRVLKPDLIGENVKIRENDLKNAEVIITIG